MCFGVCSIPESRHMIDFIDTCHKGVMEVGSVFDMRGNAQSRRVRLLHNFWQKGGV